jgi:hypothetical protein
MKTAIKPTTTFRTELTKNINAKIRELKKDGTTGMSLSNLRMVTKTPSPYLPSAPSGPTGYGFIFRDVALKTPAIRRFLITTDY